MKIFGYILLTLLAIGLMSKMLGIILTVIFIAVGIMSLVGIVMFMNNVFFKKQGGYQR